MKQAAAFAAIVFAAASGAPVQAGAVESRITEVTVFADRAAVTRSTEVKLGHGPQVVELGPLPSGIEPDSVTAKGRGDAQVTIHSVQVAVRQLETAQDPRVGDLEGDIRDVQRRQQAEMHLKEILAQEREYLNSIQAASSEQIGKDLITKAPSASDAASLLAFLDKSLIENYDRQQKADGELQDLARELDKLQRELRGLTHGRQRQQTFVLVDLESADSGAFGLDVSYRVPGAGWQPGYEAHAATTADDIELRSYGLVRQQTGEDWADVRVTLSTARPAVAGTMPELAPWFLRPWEPPVVFNARREAMMKASAPMALADGDMDDMRTKDDRPSDAVSEEQAEVQATLAQAAVLTQGPAVTYVLSKRETIPSDWQPHRVPIAAQRFAASLAYETTPRLAPFAFLRAKAVNTTDILYLSGPVAVTLDGAFVATAQLEQVAPGEAFDLYLGIDERVKVERKTLKERVEVSLLPGLRGKTKSTDYQFLATVENFTGRRIQVTVFDQVPVSEREEIIIESVKTVPAEVVKDEEKPGVFHWLLDLAPGQKEELTLNYRVRHPVDMMIQ